MSTILRAGGVILGAVAATACADRDNPTALADLQADVRYASQGRTRRDQINEFRRRSEERSTKIYQAYERIADIEAGGEG